MLSGKFLFTLVGIVLAIFAMCNLDFMNKPVVEGWWDGIQLTTTAMPYLQSSNGAKTAFSGNYFDPKSLMGSGKFVSVPSFQAVISPRFSNAQYGANIRYNMPDRKNQAVPCDPLTFSDMAQENYNGQRQPMHRENYNGSQGSQGSQGFQGSKEDYSCGTGQCGMSDGLSCGKGGYGLGHKVAGGYELPVGYTNGNYSDVYNSLPGNVVSQPCSDSSNADLPVGTMNTMDGNGMGEQFVVMNRLMTTNMKSKLRAQGDPIRGDLAITPCQSGWFSVYPTINTDLQPGALNVLSGFSAGESNAKLMELLMNASGSSKSTYGGVDFSQMNQPPVDMTPQTFGSLSAAQSDVQFSSFP